MNRRRRSTAIAALTLAVSTLLAPAAAVAAEVTPAEVADGADQATISELNATITENSRKWLQLTENDDRVQQLSAFSPAMGREIPLAVIPAGEPNAPTLYLLNGAGGAEQNMDWITSGDVVDFYAGRGVNVVIPQAGAFSYYMDWAEDPNGSYLKGPQKWETFLTQELPGPIEEHLQANDRRAVVGFSMSATSSLLFAGHNPGFYDAVGSFSGCAATSDPASYKFADITVNRGGATAAQMLGPLGSQHNRDNDALVHAAGLRGTELYISNASGMAGEYDMPGYYIRNGMDPLAASVGTAQLQIEGGIIEAATNWCTHNLKAKLDAEGIPAEWNFRETGTHSWSYWLEDLDQSWPTLARGLGLGLE